MLKMEEIRKKLNDWIFNKLKVPAHFVMMLAIIIPSICYISLTKPYISILGNVVAFDLPTFEKCTITFNSPLNILSYSLEKVTNSGVPNIDNHPVDSQKIAREINVLPIENTYKPQQNGAEQKYRVTIFLGSTLESEMSAVTINNTNVDIKSFFQNNLKTKGQFIEFRYIRKAIANIIFAFNDKVSNFLLTILVAGIIVFVFVLVDMELKANFYSDNYFKNYLIKSLKIPDMTLKDARKEAFAKYAARWYVLMTRFKFFQALGPAIGFILTVSSLIAALHPALHASNDLGGFIDGIHVAMISTFLGLLLRIIALEASRVNDLLLDRAEAQLGEPD